MSAVIPLRDQMAARKAEREAMKSPKPRKAPERRVVRREFNSALSLMRKHGLTASEARLVAESFPIRGTKAWEERERLRRWCGNRCLSFGDGQ